MRSTPRRTADTPFVTAPPSDVRTIPTLQGVRFVLPSHPMLRFAGLFPLGFGLVFAGFAVFWILGAAGAISSTPPGQQQQPGGLAILFPLFGLPFVIVGLAPVLLGVVLVFGRPEFEIRADSFRSGIRLGPLRRAKWRPIDAIERFEVNRFGSPGSSNAMHVLRAHVGEERPLNITGSADPVWLERLADAFVERIDRGELSDEPPPIITRDRDPDLDADETPPDVIPPGVPDPGPPPDDCALWAEESPTGPTIFIPPRGMRAKPVPALLTFAIFWLAITNVIAVGMIGGLAGSGHVVGPILAGAMLLLFEGIGVGMLIYALSLARRRAILDVTDHARTLLVTRSGLRRSSQREITAADIESIQVRDSGTSINDVPLRQVTIRVFGGDDLDLLTGAPEPHLQWLARKLRHALTTPD